MNPLVRDASGRVLALDGKVSLDDNAAFRRRSQAQLAGDQPRDPREAQAAARGLNYVKLEGEVGVIGNGAGLVMSTLDVVADAGRRHGDARPANFLDIGGGASAAVMTDGLDIVLGDPDVLWASLESETAQLPVLVEVMVEREANAAMGPALDAITEFEPAPELLTAGGPS